MGGVGLGAGPGWLSGRAGCQDGRLATHATETFLGAPRALTCLLVGDEVAVDDVGEASFQRPDRFLAGFAFSQFPFVEDASFGVGVAELGDGDQMQRVVEHPVASRVEPMPLPRPRGGVDGSGPVVGGVVMSGGEPGHFSGVADKVRAAGRTELLDAFDEPDSGSESE